MVETGTIEESTWQEVSPKHRCAKNYMYVNIIPCVYPIGNKGLPTFHGGDPFTEVQTCPVHVSVLITAH